MTVLVMDRVEGSVRGELTRWFLELKPGVFVGMVNARVRALLWERICQEKIETGAVLVYRANNEQGFEMHISGEPKREVVDLEGIQLVRVKNTETKESEKAKERQEEYLPGFHFHLDLLEE